MELDCISHPLHCYFWSNNTLLFHSQAGAKKQLVCNQSFWKGSEGGGGGGGGGVAALCLPLCTKWNKCDIRDAGIITLMNYGRYNDYGNCHRLIIRLNLLQLSATVARQPEML